MKIRVLLLLVGALLFVPVFAQVAPVIDWQKSYGGSDFDYARSVAQTNDGGYIVAGFSRSTDGDVANALGNFDSWIVKLDCSGAVQWQRSLGGSEEDRAYEVAQTSDGGFIIAGYSSSIDGDVTSNNGFSDYWIVKLDSNGSIEWQSSLGGSGLDFASSIAQTSDGGYIVAGSSNSTDGDVTNNHGVNDYWIAKLDNFGIIQWQKSFGGSIQDYAFSIAQTSDGGYIVAGEASSIDGDVTNNHGGSDCWVLKLDIVGTIQWQRTLGGSDDEFANSIIQTIDGGYILAGSALSIDGDVSISYGLRDAWIVKLSSSGTIEWERSYGGSGFDSASSIAQASDGGYIVAGSSESTDFDVTNNNGNRDYWVI